MHGNTSELIQLGTMDVMSDDVVRTVRTVRSTKVSRIVEHSVPIEAPIAKNKLPTFKSSNTKGQSTSKSENKEMKLHIRLFSQMYISTQIRGGDMDDFFSHEILKSWRDSFWLQSCAPRMPQNAQRYTCRSSHQTVSVPLARNSERHQS